MDRVRDTSKHRLKLSVTIFKIKVTGSRKGQTENFMFEWRDNFFLVQLFVKDAKNESRTHFERPKSDKLWKPGKCRSPSERREK